MPDTTAASVFALLEEVDYRNNKDWKLLPCLGERYAGQETLLLRLVKWQHVTMVVTMVI